jgi:outer membrane protein OmpA-like peptidoglycan-associated protein
MSPKPLACLTLLLIGIACLQAPAATAGPFGKLKKKAKETTQAVDKAIEDTGDAPATEPKTSNEGGAEASGGRSGTSSTAGTAGGGPGAAVSSVSTKFDFVSGDSVMFYDTFTQDELGEFPARWKLVSGTFEVAEAGGERWVRCVSTDGQIQMKVPPVNALPEYWTLEFDADHLDNAGNTLTVSGLAADGQTIWTVVLPYSGQNVFSRAGEITSDTPFEGTFAGSHHIMFMARGTALKAYVDRQRMASIPDVTEKGIVTKIEFRLWSSQKPMLSNVRFAEGCRPAKDMLAEGKLVTYGIHFDTGSDVVLPESAPVLRQVAAYLESKPDLRLSITGFTDNVGTSAANLDLSKRRAASVAGVLASQFHIAAGRFRTDGRGDAEPVATNKTPEGRAMNRRVVFEKQAD